jgi:AmmeMemoRadiSam system protein A
MTYTSEEQTILLDLARSTLESITEQRPMPSVDLAALPPALQQVRACFVTMRQRADGTLRGCTGTLIAQRPLAEEVVHMTIQTAFHDPRFPQVKSVEVPHLRLEISILTPSEPLSFRNPDDLLSQLRPGIDGVTLRLGERRATFLPQVWESYPNPREFLGLLCEKMGFPATSWRDPALQAETYQAIVIEEPA